ncbi:hypothetical protein INQ51_17115 [Maribellus sp. CM-23]|uniref:ComF family protein n=1 Tax=Maribellus sp. CM-23 TaxID=2781026 RepID=UPI001F35B302|nr:phosphoribosyltransferase family protein [Maribellus sp. CM-23]MCE4566043.1 hypothetical protein [Maribellus sp. CM-23]
MKTFDLSSLIPEPIKHYGTYHPYRGGNNEKFDEFSKKILRFKDDYDWAVEYFFERLKNYFEDSIDAIMVIPSHDPDRKKTGIKDLAEKLADYNGWKNCCECLVRYKKIEKLAQGGDRSISNHKESMKFVKKTNLDNKTVLLIDDVTTTGNSLRAGKKVLLESGIKKVILFAIAQTAWD